MIELQFVYLVRVSYTSDLLLNNYKGNVYLGFATRDITEADLLPQWS